MALVPTAWSWHFVIRYILCTFLQAKLPKDMIISGSIRFFTFFFFSRVSTTPHSFNSSLLFCSSFCFWIFRSCSEVLYLKIKYLKTLSGGSGKFSSSGYREIMKLFLQWNESPCWMMIFAHQCHFLPKGLQQMVIFFQNSNPWRNVQTNKQLIIIT